MVSGHDASLEMVKKGYMEGIFSKQDFETALRSYQASRDETKTPQRDRANAEEGYWKWVIKNVGYYKLQIFCNADLFSKRRRRFSSREFQSFPQIFLRKHKKTEMILASWWKNLKIREKKTFVSFPKRDARFFLLQKNSNL